MIVRDKVTRQRPQTITSEVKGEPKRIRTEVLLLTSLMPCRQAQLAHNAILKVHHALKKEMKCIPTYLRLVYPGENPGTKAYTVDDLALKAKDSRSAH